MQIWFPAIAAFLGTAVEGAEALTIVLAVGLTAGWNAALRGAGLALVLLGAIVAIFGPALVHFVPIDVLRVVVGVFLLLLGVDWLRKGILRYAGRKALRNEAAAFARAEASIEASGVAAERLGFALAFKSTFLEGLESVIIVITIGATGADGRLQIAGLGAALAVVVVIALGIALRRPLAQLSDNALKTFAGVMLTSFGTFWTGEGIGLAWWHDDLSIPLLVAFYIGLSAVAVALVKRPAASAPRTSTAA